METNKNGYVGVHYVIEAAPADSFYYDSDDSNDSTIYPHFELQVRTLISHAWSEIQHRLVYKEENTWRPRDQQLGDRFGDLAIHFVAADNNLWRITNSRTTKHVRTFAADFLHETEYRDLLTKIAECVRQLDSNLESVSLRRRLCDRFLEENHDAIEPLRIAKRPYEVVVELAEIYAKGNRHQEALELYEACVKRHNADGKVYLRLAECYDALGKAEHAVKCLYDLQRLLRKRVKFLPRDHILFMGAGVTAWRYNEKKLAVAFGRASVSAMPPDTSPTEEVTVLSNHAYFEIELIEEQLNAREKTEENAFNELMQLSGAMDRVIAVEKGVQDKAIFRAGLYDNIAWYFYKLAALAPIRDIQRDYCARALQYSEMTHAHWKQYEAPFSEIHETWRLHSREINRLLKRLERTPIEPDAVDVANTRVFISYAWKADVEIVDRICSSFSEREVRVGRDIHEIEFKCSIEEFMKRLRDGRAVIIVLSQAYFESFSCLTELLELSDHKDFLDRIFPVQLPGVELADTTWVTARMKYWDKKIGDLKASSQFDNFDIGESITKQIEEKILQYERIAKMVFHIADLLREMAAITSFGKEDLELSKLIDAVLLRIGPPSVPPDPALPYS